MTSCPSTDDLRRLLDEDLPVAAERTMQTHLEGCAACQAALEHLAAAGPSWHRAARMLATVDEPGGPGLEAVVEKLEASDAPPSTPPTVSDTHAEPHHGRADEFAYLDPPSEPGHLGRLGNYEILELVGRGGMGVVFKARDDRLQRIVAIKVLAPQYAASGSARERFAREARATAAVSHDHVVPIYDVTLTRGISYLVMPLVPGKSLQDRIDQQGPLELKEILRIGSQIAAGLAAAHKQGLVHRDIKPANILLENGVERVKITDFGLAKALDDASVTQSGVITGTPMFMSPEQARGEFTGDARSDLFSLGSVLYIMATGRAPFRASGSHAVIHRVINDTPRPIRELRPELPDWFESIVAKLHAKNPADRFQSALELADLFSQHLAHLQEPRRVPRPETPEPPAAVVSEGQVAAEPIRLLLDATDVRRRLLQHCGLAIGFALCVMSAVTAIRSGHFHYMNAGGLLIGSLSLAMASQIKQQWQVRYRGHSIRVENRYLRLIYPSPTMLFIDGVRVARGGIRTPIELRGFIPRGEAAGDEIVVRCDAKLTGCRCRIFVEPQAAPAESDEFEIRRPRVPGWAIPATVMVALGLILGCGLLGGSMVVAVVLFFMAQDGAMQGPMAPQVEVRAFAEPDIAPMRAVPNDAAAFLGFRNGAWTVAPEGRPGERAAPPSIARFEWIAGENFERGHLPERGPNPEEITVTWLDPAAVHVRTRSYAFDAHGEFGGPWADTWDPARHALTSQSRRHDNGELSSVTMEYSRADQMRLTIKRRDAGNALKVDAAYCLTRIDPDDDVAPAAPPALPVPGAPQLVLLHQLCGTWQTSNVKRFGPDGNEKPPAEPVPPFTVRSVLQGHFLEARERLCDLREPDYWIVGWDRAAGAPRMWYFSATGTHYVLGGTWDAEAKTMHWKGADGRAEGTWILRALDQRDYDFTFREADGARRRVSGRTTRPPALAPPGLPGPLPPPVPKK
jgi:serine/threonine-protein kinase